MTKRTAIAVLLAVPLAAGCAKEDAPAEPAEPAATQTSSAATPDASEGATVTLAFNVTGMTCDGCVAMVASTVEALEGVTSCEVSLDEERAVVEARNPDDAAAIVAAITGIGYEAALADASADSPDESLAGG